MQKEGLFVVIEGLDGSGKSSASAALQHQLETKWPRTTKRSYEPHNPSCGGDYIRDVLEKRITQFDPFVLALAYAANRLDHNSRVINPWLSGDTYRTLICDRYYLSSLVYNSSDTFSYEQVMLLNKQARRPDIIFFLNVTAEVCRERMNRRNEPIELFESKLDLYREKYFTAIKFLQQERGEVVVEIDGTLPLKQVVETMRRELESRFG